MEDKTALRTEVLKFMRAHPACVLATTASGGQPEAATVLFAVDDDFSLYFGTDRQYRKYANLLANRKAAVVVGTSPEDPREVQIEGEIEILESSGDAEGVKKIFESKNPAMVPFLKLPLVFMRLRPVWMRFLDETKGGINNFQQII